MSKPRSLTPELETALAHLAALATAGAGYERRGVRGWARTRDVEDTFSTWLPERYPRLALRGLAERDDVRAPGLQRPVWVYRIARDGWDFVYRRNGASTPEFREPHDEPDGAVFLPPAPLSVIRELRRALEDPTPSPHVPGENGWRSATQMLRYIREETHDRAFFHEDLRWLVRGGLVDRRDVALPGGQALVLYRVTPAGLAILPLAWHAPPVPSPGAMP